MRAPLGGMGFVAGLLLAATAAPVWAQGVYLSSDVLSIGTEVPRQLPFVTVDEAVLFSQSKYGKRLLDELEVEQTALAGENRRLEAELSEREQALTAQRNQMSAEAFRDLAEEFNREVERYRAEQSSKERDIYQRHEQERALFRDLSNQALAEILTERGALAVIAEEAIVLAFKDIDVTQITIAKLDELVGDGSSLPKPDQERETPSDAKSP